MKNRLIASRGKRKENYNNFSPCIRVVSKKKRIIFISEKNVVSDIGREAAAEKLFFLQCWFELLREKEKHLHTQRAREWWKIREIWKKVFLYFSPNQHTHELEKSVVLLENVACVKVVVLDFFLLNWILRRQFKQQKKFDPTNIITKLINYYSALVKAKKNFKQKLRRRKTFSDLNQSDMMTFEKVFVNNWMKILTIN